MKRAHKGTFHKSSSKYLDRYVQEFADKYNIRCRNTLGQIDEIVRGMEDKHLTYIKLKRNNGLSAVVRL